MSIQMTTPKMGLSGEGKLKRHQTRAIWPQRMGWKDRCKTAVRGRGMKLWKDIWWWTLTGVLRTNHMINICNLPCIPTIHFPRIFANVWSAGIGQEVKTLNTWTVVHKGILERWRSNLRQRRKRWQEEEEKRGRGKGDRIKQQGVLSRKEGTQIRNCPKIGTLVGERWVKAIVRKSPHMVMCPTPLTLSQDPSGKDSEYFSWLFGEEVVFLLFVIPG